MAPPKNNFKMYAAIGVIMALLCLVFAGISFASAAVTGPQDEALCSVGASGMSPHVEIALIQQGVYKPSPNILWQIGNSPQTPSNWGTYNAGGSNKAFGLDWNFLGLRLIVAIE